MPRCPDARRTTRIASERPSPIISVALEHGAYHELSPAPLATTCFPSTDLCCPNPCCMQALTTLCHPLLCATLLQECEADEAMLKLVPDIKGADPMAAALLIECRGRDEAALKVRLHGLAWHARARRGLGMAALRGLVWLAWGDVSMEGRGFRMGIFWGRTRDVVCCPQRASP